MDIHRLDSSHWPFSAVLPGAQRACCSRAVAQAPPGDSASRPPTRFPSCPREGGDPEQRSCWPPPPQVTSSLLISSQESGNGQTSPRLFDIVRSEKALARGGREAALAFQPSAPSHGHAKDAFRRCVFPFRHPGPSTPPAAALRISLAPCEGRDPDGRDSRKQALSWTPVFAA